MAKHRLVEGNVAETLESTAGINQHGLTHPTVTEPHLELFTDEGPQVETARYVQHGFPEDRPPTGSSSAAAVEMPSK